MNKGVQILLERMSSNPDEFVPEMPLGAVGRKWRDIIEAVQDRVKGRVGDTPYFSLQFLSDEEVLAIHTKLQEIRGELFTKDIMARLLADDSSREASRHSVGGGSNNVNTLSAGSVQYATSIALGRSQLTDEKMEILDEMIKAQEAKVQAELQRKYMKASGK